MMVWGIFRTDERNSGPGCNKILFSFLVLHKEKEFCFEKALKKVDLQSKVFITKCGALYFSAASKLPRYFVPLDSFSTALSMITIEKCKNEST